MSYLCPGCLLTEGGGYTRQRGENAVHRMLKAQLFPRSGDLAHVPPSRLKEYHLDFSGIPFISSLAQNNCC